MKDRLTKEANDSIHAGYEFQGRELINTMEILKIQHIDAIPTFTQLASHYKKTNRRFVKLFLKADDSPIMKFPLIKLPLKFAAKGSHKLYTLIFK